MDRIGPGRRRAWVGGRQLEEETFEAGVLGWGEPAQCDAVGHRRAGDDLGLGVDQPPIAVCGKGGQAGAVERGIEAGEVVCLDEGLGLGQQFGAGRARMTTNTRVMPTSTPPTSQRAQAFSPRSA
jgi:hypothetical protein